MTLIQQSATSESLQQVIFLIGTSHFSAPSAAVTNLASMTSAKSSNLGFFGSQWGYSSLGCDKLHSSARGCMNLKADNGAICLYGSITISVKIATEYFIQWFHLLVFLRISLLSMCIRNGLTAIR